MIDDNLIDKVVERLARRMEKANTYILKEIGESIKQIGTINPTKVNQLIQTLKYGGNYQKIVKQISKLTKLNQKDIEKAFEEVAKNDYRFAEQFYDYRNVPYVPYEQNTTLKNQVEALASASIKDYINLTNTTALGFGIPNKDGNIVFKRLKNVYFNILDDAVLSVSQGKETFDTAMYRHLKNIGQSGLKVVYPTTYIDKNGVERHYVRRLDSAVRMNMNTALKNIHYEMQKQIAKDIDADGIEISVHENPAPDHADVQGRQFSNEQYDKLQATGSAETYNHVKIDMHTGSSFRPIREWNCKHYEFAIVLGVNKPQYSNKQLEKIKKQNIKGFEYDGKHYTMYQGTQLQRHLETEIRKLKDVQIGAKASDNQFLIGEIQNKITVLTKKYKDLCDKSGLQPRVERMKTVNYKRDSNASRLYQQTMNEMKVGSLNISKYTNQIKPTTSDVLLTPERKRYIESKHRESAQYFNKISDLVNNPDQIYLQKDRKNSVWVVKEFDGQKVQAVIKINTTSLYQQKELGYKNSIIHMHPVRDNYVKNKLNKKQIELLFDINDKK